MNTTIQLYVGTSNGHNKRNKRSNWDKHLKRKKNTFTNDKKKSRLTLKKMCCVDIEPSG